MNLLAHTLLSGHDADIIVGGLVGDHARSLHGQLISTQIARGIALHKAIDDFVDEQPFFRQSVARFGGRYRHLGGVIVDLCYDHCLALNWTSYSTTPLRVFVNHTYVVLSSRRPSFPPHVRNFIDSMILEDWLYSYRKMEGIEAALDRVAGRLRRPPAVKQIVTDIRQMHDALEQDFASLFPTLITFSERTLIELEP